MTPEAFSKLIRQLPGGSELSVRKDPVHARKLGIHEECLQVWDVGVVSGDPYHVISIHASGQPREPYEADVREIQRMSADVVHQGRPGWIDEMSENQAAIQINRERAIKDDMDERMAQEVKPRAEHRVGIKKLIPSKQ